MTEERKTKVTQEQQALKKALMSYCRCGMIVASSWAACPHCGKIVEVGDCHEG